MNIYTLFNIVDLRYNYYNCYDFIDTVQFSRDYRHPTFFHTHSVIYTQYLMTSFRESTINTRLPVLLVLHYIKIFESIIKLDIVYIHAEHKISVKFGCKIKMLINYIII